MTAVQHVQVRRLTKTATPAEISAAIDDDGVVIVEDLIPPDLLARLNADLDPVLSEMDPTAQYENDAFMEAFWGRQTKRAMGLAEFSDAFVELLQNETMLGVADIRQLPNSKDYILSTGMAIQIGPGQPAQALHPDDALWPALMGPEMPDAVTFMIVACNDFTEANGATRVVPGSHKWPVSAKPMANPEVKDTDIESVAAEMRAGSVAFLTGKTVHGGGANLTTDTVRRGVFIGYCLGWLRGEEAVPLAMTPDRLRQLPEPVRYLLGWGGHGSRFKGDYPSGWAYKMDDPIKIFECGADPRE